MRRQSIWYAVRIDDAMKEMAMTLDTLRRLMPPPAHPFNAGSPEEWPAVEERLGFRLPQDYKDFINLYGAGRIAHFMVIFSPWYPNSIKNLIDGPDEHLDQFRIARERDVEECPYPLFPDPNGLFPWGFEDQNDYLMWLQVGDPDRWPIVVISGDSGIWRYERTLTELLVAWLSFEQFYKPFPVWYLDEEQFPKNDDEVDTLVPRKPNRPRTPEEAQALFQPFRSGVGD